METKSIFELLGAAGSFVMCVSAVPQIVKTYRMKRADGLSGSYLTALTTGLSLVMVYALHTGDMVFIFGNALSLMLTVILAGLWYQYGNRHKR
ncbi:MAG: SemiSWEET family sugar transporter [Thermodesulfobacteriota bacterium]